MNDNSAVLFAYTTGYYAQIEAMKLQNQLDKEADRTLTYSSEDFFAIQSNLETLINNYR